jgi:predicted PurR-regulated permease PerM
MISLTSRLTKKINKMRLYFLLLFILFINICFSQDKFSKADLKLVKNKLKKMTTLLVSDFENQITHQVGLIQK